MGLGRTLLSKMLRCTVPWALVVLPVFCLFSAFLALVADNPSVNVDLFGMVCGTISFSAGLIYMALKHERAIEEEAL